ncbi:MAG: DMT family transporter [Hyphomicrobiales bacterium]
MTRAVFLAAFAAVVIWSGGPVATKLAVNELPVWTVAILRTCLGGVVALPLAIGLGLPLPRQRKQIALLLASGLSSYVAFPLLFCLGMTRTSGTHGVMILAFLPVLTGLMAHVSQRRVPHGLCWLGCLIALAGELLLLSTSNVTAQSTTPLGDPLVFAAAFFLALGYVTGGHLTRSGYPAQGTAYWTVVIGSLVLAPVIPYAVTAPDLASAGAIAWASVVYLAIGVTVVGYILWFWAMARGGIAEVGLMQFFQPISGVILAHVLLDEPLSLLLFASAALVIGGIAIANRDKAG